MTNIYDGTHLFVWQADRVQGGDVQKMIAAARALGVTGVILKFADGNLVGDPVSQQFMADFKRLAPQFKAAGLVVGGWIYQYLTDPAGEADACFQAIQAGADWIVLDAESDVYGKKAQVQQFGQLLRSRYPHIPVGLSSFAIANYHAQVPFAEYAAFVDVMMPQIYWAEMGWDVAVAFHASVASYQPYGKPIAPTGQAYDKAKGADMARWVALAKEAGYTGISWWDWQHMAAEHSDAVQMNLLAVPKTQSPAAPVAAPTSPASAPAPVVSHIAADVADNAWYAKAVAYALQEGLMSLDSNSHFNPEQPVTRAMLAQVIYNMRHQPIK